MAKGRSDTKPKAKPEAKEEKRAYEDTVHRAFSILQYKGRPFEDYEEDRITLKPGANPLITEETIIHALNYKTIKRWAWVWHDKDVYTPKDEAEDETHRIKAGEHKFCHAHIMMRITGAAISGLFPPIAAYPCSEPIYALSERAGPGLRTKLEQRGHACAWRVLWRE